MATCESVCCLTQYIVTREVCVYMCVSMCVCVFNGMYNFDLC